MNPENRGENIVLRHSSLWRKPLLYDKPSITRASTCHHQLNQTAQSGIHWKERNSFIRTRTPSTPKTPINRRTVSKQLSNTLDHSTVNNEHAKKMIRTLKTEAESIDKTPKLVNGMAQLKQLHLLVTKELTKVSYMAPKMAVRTQQYRGRKTNPGFGRSMCGRFYTS